VATSSVYLSGGPCAGRTVSASQIQGGLVGYVLCQGHYYLDSGRTRSGGETIFADSGTSPPQAPGGGGGAGAGVAPQAHQGWGGLRRAINQELPAALRAINRNQQAALRELAHRRRVNR
jgi:hypothetical protein